MNAMIPPIAEGRQVTKNDIKTKLFLNNLYGKAASEVVKQVKEVNQTKEVKPTKKTRGKSNGKAGKKSNKN